MQINTKRTIKQSIAKNGSLHSTYTNYHIGKFITEQHFLIHSLFSVQGFTLNTPYIIHLIYYLNHDKMFHFQGSLIKLQTSFFFQFYFVRNRMSAQKQTSFLLFSISFSFSARYEFLCKSQQKGLEIVLKIKSISLRLHKFAKCQKCPN